MNGLPAVFQTRQAQAPLPPKYTDKDVFIQAVNFADQYARFGQEKGLVKDSATEYTFRNTGIRDAYNAFRLHTGEKLERGPDLPNVFYIPEGKQTLYPPPPEFLIITAGPSGLIMTKGMEGPSVLGKQAYSGEGPITGVKRARAGKRKTRKGRKSTKRRSTRK